MELIRSLHNLNAQHQRCVTTIGAFDGVHRGHQAVLQQLIDKGKELGLPSVVVVFEPLPREYFSPLKAPARLMSFREKFLAFKAMGIDRLLRIHFTSALREMDARDFIKRVLVDLLHSKYIIVGDDLHFGRGRAGTFKELRAAGVRLGFDVVATSTFSLSEARVSSTRIRQALEKSDFELAQNLLGRPYSILGRVITGQQLGRQINVPTANVQLRRIRSALSGVYAVEVQIDKQVYIGVANVGTRPTVDDSLKAILEVHLLDFDDNIYGKNIEVIFRNKIREEKKFDSISELKQQIYKDIETGRQYFKSH
ncbi:MAG: bifunctional riboflavin kinase/FAD synthetase [Spongiibacteraceae bacterium]|nr:bifunctional riboflavin kinase/FAD synthetase [Spongiibacteraceae bacterium]